MNRFAPLIRATSRRIDLPQPARARVLVEMAADLEDLFDHYVARGAGEEEAFERACEHFDLSEEALHRLVEVHASPLRRLLERVSERTRVAWERAVFILVAAYATAATLEVMMTTNFFLDASKTMWPVMALGVIAVAVAATKFYSLVIKGDHDPRRARRGLTTLLSIAVMSAIIGCFTLVAELMMLAFRTVSTPERAFAGVVLTVAKIAPVMMISLLVSVVAAVFWYVFSRGASRIEQAEAEALLAAGAAEGGAQ